MFVAEGEEELYDGEVAEGGGEVEGCVAEAEGGGIGVVEEGGVGFEDARDEEGGVGVDCAAETEGGFDPGWKKGGLAQLMIVAIVVTNYSQTFKARMRLRLRLENTSSANR